MAIDFKTLNGIMPHILKAGFPVMVRGRHGIGKSQVAYQTADDLGLEVVERRASQMTEGDLLGLPDTSEMEIAGEAPSHIDSSDPAWQAACSETGHTKTVRKVTTWNAPDWFATACERPVLLFLDEVDRATLEVRQGLFELTDSRKLNGWHLHPGTVIIAAVNGGEHGAQYQVGELDPAEIDRWTVYDVEPTTEDWLAWANGRVHKIVWDFINQNRSHLEHETADFEPNKVYPSRRSWDRFSTTAAPLGVFDEGGDGDLLYNLACGFLGFEAAVALRDFVSKYEHQVTIEQILDDGEIDRTKDFGINEHAALVEKMAAAGIFKEKLSDERTQNLGEYFLAIPAEIGMKLWTILGDSENSVENVIAMHGVVRKSDDKLVSDHLIEILAGSDDD